MVGQREQILVINVVGGNAVGFADARGKVIVGGEELDRADLLERVVAPVLVEIEYGEVLGLTGLEGYGEVGLAESIVAAVEQGLFLFVGKVLADLQGNRQQHVALAKQHAVFKASAVRVGHHVDIAVNVVARNIKD